MAETKSIQEYEHDLEMVCLVEQILEDYNNGREIDNMDIHELPDQDVVIEIARKMLMIIFPGYYKDNTYRTKNLYSKLSVQIEEVMYLLQEQIQIVLNYKPEFADAERETRNAEARRLCLEFFRTIPKLREWLNTDLDAAYDGDPAATNKQEIVLAYPGYLAIAIYRIAHELYMLRVPLIPRMMTEFAHRETGVDIHPGATIGKYFFIDHATGIVVGSTSIIGEHVKVYQGVTIGALSTKEGHKLHGTKRHPTIEDNVTLYSGASVLGGNTIIGEGSVVGGNAFVTESVPPNSRVSIKTDVSIVTGRKKL